MSVEKRIRDARLSVAFEKVREIIFLAAQDKDVKVSLYLWDSNAEDEVPRKISEEFGIRVAEISVTKTRGQNAGGYSYMQGDVESCVPVFFAERLLVELTTEENDGDPSCIIDAVWRLLASLFDDINFEEKPKLRRIYNKALKIARK